jgi:hypothetical protein
LGTRRPRAVSVRSAADAPKGVRTDVSIEKKDSNAALKVLEKVARYEVMLKKPDADIPPEDAEVHERLIAEYYVLRTALVSILSSIPNIPY